MEECDIIFAPERCRPPWDVSIGQLNMQGRTQEVWATGINLGVSEGRKCEMDPAGEDAEKGTVA